jgi:hypothetical protein
MTEDTRQPSGPRDDPTERREVPSPVHTTNNRETG